MSERRNYLFALGAGLVVSSAALAYYYLANRSPLDNLQEPEVVANDLKVKLETQRLLKPVFNSQKMLDPSYFLNLLQMVSVETQAAMHKNHKIIIAERRKAYQAEQWETYRRAVKVQIDLDCEVSNKILAAICSLVGLQVEEF